MKKRTIWISYIDSGSTEKFEDIIDNVFELNNSILRIRTKENEAIYVPVHNIAKIRYVEEEVEE